MNLKLIALLSAAVVLVCSPTLSHAATVGTLTCHGYNGTTVTANLSYYNIGLTEPLNIGSGSGGAGAGKIKFNPVEIHTSLTNFQEFFAPIESGSAFSTCVLASTAGRDTIDYTFKLAAISSVNAIARTGPTADDNPAAYLDVFFEYGGLQVATSGGADTGGTEGDWARLKNSPY